MDMKSSPLVTTCWNPETNKAFKKIEEMYPLVAILRRAMGSIAGSITGTVTSTASGNSLNNGTVSSGFSNSVVRAYPLTMVAQQSYGSLELTHAGWRAAGKLRKEKASLEKQLRDVKKRNATLTRRLNNGLPFSSRGIL